MTGHVVIPVTIHTLDCFNESTDTVPRNSDLPTIGMYWKEVRTRPPRFLWIPTIWESQS